LSKICRLSSRDSEGGKRDEEKERVFEKSVFDYLIEVCFLKVVLR